MTNVNLLKMRKQLARNLPDVIKFSFDDNKDDFESELRMYLDRFREYMRLKHRNPNLLVHGTYRYDLGRQLGIATFYVIGGPNDGA